MSEQVLQQLLQLGKINFVKGEVRDKAKAIGSYVPEWNTIYIGAIRNSIIHSPDDVRDFYFGMGEETFHAYQNWVYNGRRNNFCWEFEAKVYGNIVLYRSGYETWSVSNHFYHQFTNNTPKYIRDGYIGDLRRLTGDFQHGITQSDMNYLYVCYGPYWMGWDSRDPDWEFRAIDRAQMVPDI